MVFTPQPAYGPPRTTDPSNFPGAADDWVAWQAAFGDDMEAFAVNLAGGFTGTSTTSLAIGTGSKSFAAGAGTAGKAWQVGQPVMAASASGPTNAMAGVVTAYNSTTGALTVLVASVSGSGTKTDWVISLLPASTISAFIATLLDDADAATARTTLGAAAKAGDTFTGNVNFGDANFHLRLDAGNPVLQLNSNAYIAYDRAAGLLRFMVGTTKLASISFISGEIRSIAAITGSTTVA